MERLHLIMADVNFLLLVLTPAAAGAAACMALEMAVKKVLNGGSNNVRKY